MIIMLLYASIIKWFDNKKFGGQNKMGEIFRRASRNIDYGGYLADVEKAILAFIEPQQYFYDGSDCSFYRLLGYGVHGAEAISSIGSIVQHFNWIQSMYGKEYKNFGRLYCESFCVSADEIKNMDAQTLIAIAGECADTYLINGHQVLYAVYCNDSGTVLIHFLVNPINHKGYRHWRYSPFGMGSRADLFNCILGIYKSKIVTSPIIFTNCGVQGYKPIGRI